MKGNKLICILTGLLIASLYYSCKKDELSTIDRLLTSGTWELASMQVYNYIGDTQESIDTLNRDCDVKQYFKFNDDNTCTYTNYYCIEQQPTGNWSLSEDKLYMVSDIQLQDTTATGEPGTSRPFSNTKILNLGQYSMVIQTGDLQSNYPANQRRRIVQYGFVKQRTN